MLISSVLANLRLQSHASQLIAGHPLLQEPRCHRIIYLGQPFSHPHLAMSPQLVFIPSPLDAYHPLLDLLGLDGLAIDHVHEHCY